MKRLNNMFIIENDHEADIVKWFDSQIDYHKSKWVDYEQEYILPCFAFAESRGIDLRQLVRDNPGKNCVMLLLNELSKHG